MTTYGTDLRIGTAPRGNTATLPRSEGNLNRTAKTFPGGKSEIKPFRQATNKSPSTAPKSPSSDGTAKTVGKVANTAMGIGKKTLGKISPGIGINSKGDIDIGLRAGGAGISLSTKGEISLGIGIGQVTFDPKNKNVGKVEIGLGVASSEATQDGCTITVTDRVLGKIVNQYTRQADDCVEPEPTPTPTPTPTPSPSPEPEPEPEPEPDTPPNPLPPKTPKAQNVPPPGYNGPLYIESVGTYSGMIPGSVGIVYANVTTSIMGTTHYPLAIDNPHSANSVEVIFSVYPEDPAPVTFNTNYWQWGGLGEALPDPYFPARPAKPLKTSQYSVTYLSGIYYGARLIERKVRPPVNLTKTLPIRIMPEENCDCELLEDIYDMLGGDDFRDDGLEIPNHLFIPGGTGETKALTYNALLNLVFRTLDHRTVGEVEVSIKDNNIMKEGDQPLTMKLINATAATGKILELSQKQDSDLTAVLNLLMRLSWISVQILKVVNIGSEATKTIVSFFAIPVKEKVINVDIPVDPSLGGKVGFDPKKPTEDQLIKVLDLDDPQKTVGIFDKFMNNSKIPVKVKQFIGDKSGGNYWWLMDKNKK